MSTNSPGMTCGLIVNCRSCPASLLCLGGCRWTSWRSRRPPPPCANAVVEDNRQLVWRMMRWCQDKYDPLRSPDLLPARFTIRSACSLLHLFHHMYNTQRLLLLLLAPPFPFLFGRPACVSSLLNLPHIDSLCMCCCACFLSISPRVTHFFVGLLRALVTFITTGDLVTLRNFQAFRWVNSSGQGEYIHRVVRSVPLGLH